MTQLKTALKKLAVNPIGDIAPDLEIDRVTEVSGECDERTMFVAIPGHRADGHEYLADAAKHGAKVALVCRDVETPPEGLTLVRVEDTRAVLGPLAHEVAGNPSHKMDVLGITGTNGKTTTAYLMEEILRACGKSPGLLSTVTTRWGGEERESKETTPSGAKIADVMKAMAGDGVDSVAMEVSSHAIDQDRIAGIRFAAMALTNVTQDHLDYHKTMEDYVATKKSVFESLAETSPGAIAVVNVDDAVGKDIAKGLDPKVRIAYGIRAQMADLLAESIFFHDEGMRLNLVFRGQSYSFDSPMHCHFNAQNLMAGIGLGFALGLDPEKMNEGCKAFRGAPGRFEFIKDREGVPVIVDYAHTPDALTQVLLNARGFARGRLIVVFGCGGDRDRSKRAQMGKAAARLAHEIIVTNDNPRTEEPAVIAGEILQGVEEVPEDVRANCRLVLDRRTAIAEAIRDADRGDVVVIAGKGHENYQIVGEDVLDFDDRVTARQIIEEMRGDSVSATHISGLLEEDAAQD